MGPLSLEPDVTVAQMQVQRAFNIDIIRHKDTIDQLTNTRDDIMETCSDQQKDTLKVRREEEDDMETDEERGGEGEQESGQKHRGSISNSIKAKL